MYDDHEIAGILAPPSAGQRMRQGTIAAVNAARTIDVTIGGSAVVVGGVRYAASVCPRVGAGVWLTTDGRDWFAIATIAPEGPAFVQLRRPTDQNILDATATPINFSASPSDLIDRWGMFDTTNPTYVTIKVPGIYTAAAAVRWEANATGFRQLAIDINGVDRTIDRRLPAGAAAPCYQPVTMHSTVLEVGDQVSVVAYQNRGGSLLAVAHSTTPLAVAYLGPAPA